MRARPVLSTAVQTLKQEYPDQISRPVFSCRPGETIVIDRNITVTFVEKRGNKASIRVEAPNYVIKRNELGRPTLEEVSSGESSFSFSRKLNDIGEVDKEGFWIGPDIYVEVYKKGSKIHFATTTLKSVLVDRESVNEARLRSFRTMPDEDEK